MPVWPPKENLRGPLNWRLFGYKIRSRRLREGNNLLQYLSNKIQLYTVYLYPETALHVSCVTSTHHQERIQLYLQHLIFVTPVLLSAALVEELELESSSNSSTIVAGSSNGVTNTRCCRCVVCAPDDGWE